MSVLVQPLAYREMLGQLRLYEPLRTCFTAFAGALLFLAIPVFSLGGFVLGVYLAGDLHEVLKVLGGAVVSIGLGQLLSGLLWRRKPWRRLAAKRLAIYSAHPLRPDGTSGALLPDEALPRAWRVLSEAKLWTGNAATMLAAAPDDAPTLRNRVFITKSDALRKPGDAGAGESARAALRAAGVRARVDGVDVP